jgi:peptidoglycan/LPS O-acetylase OafA/YrhL
LDHSISYRRDIDGLRAIAVLAVVFFHCGLPIASGGYVGVDMFFVISGYVIALTLLRDLEAGRFSIRRFYEKRIRRIFPALIFVLAVCWIAAWILLLPDDFFDFSRSMLTSALSVSNFYFWRTSGYFETSALLRPLLHTWSQSVEEQFYLIAPAALWFCYRFFNARFSLLFAPAALLSLGLSIYATDTAPTANLVLGPTRAWEL